MQICRMLSLASALALAGAASLAAQEHAGQDGANPFTSAEDAAAGGRIYRAHCASCHGLDGSGGKGADLTSGRYRHGSSDEELYETISKGIPGTEMPWTFFDGKQLWQVVSFVRTLVKADQPGAAAGNPERGAELFRSKGGCLQCHMVAGEGGHGAPPLGDIGASRSAKSLKASILRPGEQVLAVDWTVRIVTKSGEKVSGRRLNEDTFSVQVLDSTGRLRSLMKSDLSSYDIDKKSGMPPYEGVLSNEEVDDIVAYLTTLRRRQL